MVCRGGGDQNTSAPELILDVRSAGQSLTGVSEVGDRVLGVDLMTCGGATKVLEMPTDVDSGIVRLHLPLVSRPDRRVAVRPFTFKSQRQNLTSWSVASSAQ
jgi:hypothetical protein